jgi:folylpolyglutamate synthase/dihydropteroate synthase
VCQREDLDSLNVIHVTGTKGKGSTCAFVDSILRRTRPGWKIGALHFLSSEPWSLMRRVDAGLYTSPHLVAVRERIRVNGVPISEELFAKFFFDVWDRLEENGKVGFLSSENISILLMHEHSQLQNRSQCISDMSRLWRFTRS